MEITLEQQRELDKLYSKIYCDLIIVGKVDNSIIVQLQELRKKLVDMELDDPIVE